MRAPRTQAEPYNVWSEKVNNAACRCLIKWPNWTGIFDTEGEQRDMHGQVVPQDAGLSTPYAECAPSPPKQLPLTEKTLNKKDVDDALNNVSKADYFNMPPTLQSLTEPDTPLGVVSIVSQRGSEVPTPTRLSVATTAEIPAVDGSTTTESGSVDSSHILHANGASDSTPEISPVSPTCNSSFESAGSNRVNHKVRKSLSENYWVLGPS